MAFVGMTTDNEIVLDGSNEWMESPCECLDADDDFSGTNCNSGAVGDYPYTCRWTEQVAAAATFAIISGKFNISYTGLGASGTQFSNLILNMPSDQSGTFKSYVDVSGYDPSTHNGSAAHVFDAKLKTDTTANTYVFFRITQLASGTPQKIIVEKNGSQVYSAVETATAFSLEISRAGSTISFKLDGSTVHTETDSADVDTVSIGSNARGATTPSVDFDNFVFESPTGTSMELCD